MNTIATATEYQDKVYGIFISTWGMDEGGDYDGEDTLCHNLGVWTNEKLADARCEALNKSDPPAKGEDETYFVKSITVKNK